MAYAGFRYYYLLLTFVALCYVWCWSPTNASRVTRKWRPHADHRTKITDFRYSSARIDGITSLFNNSLLVISNGHYWILSRGELPRAHNVRGSVRTLYDGFQRLDAVWTDPYNEVSEQLYIVSNTPKHGLRVVCQEFGEPFSNESSFCHLPVNGKWKSALKDLEFDKPIDAVTWRNRTIDKEGGFWVFFQGTKMITIDPYEMRLRYTYDLKKWMSINESITAAYYDYHSHEYHFFFPDNRYRTWKVNVTLQNKLPMSWDRAFLHGTLSKTKTINQDFFHFFKSEIRNWPQPYFEKISTLDEVEGNYLDSDNGQQMGKNKIEKTIDRESERGRTRMRTTTTTSTTENSLSDVLYVSPRGQIVNNRFPSGKLLREDNENKQSAGEAISYQKQLMQLNQEGVLDFSPQSIAINSATSCKYLTFSVIALIMLCFAALCYGLTQKLVCATYVLTL